MFYTVADIEKMNVPNVPALFEACALRDERPTIEIEPGFLHHAVDDIAEIISREKVGDSFRFRFRVNEKFAYFIAEKGSVCLDGTSFTVNEVNACEFDINIIPHTMLVTTWQHRKIGDKVNLVTY